jgi:hypothetical protein
VELAGMVILIWLQRVSHKEDLKKLKNIPEMRSANEASDEKLAQFVSKLNPF